MVEPPSLEKLVGEFASLPGIGKKTARRLAYFVLTRPREYAESLSGAILSACDRVRRCERCHAFCEMDICEICRERENAKSICVVEKFSDILPFENAGIYRGLYFVLGGVLSPLDGIGPEALHIPQLVRRIREEKIEEVIFALGSSPEADSTVLLIDKMLTGVPVKRSSLARGIPMGSELEYIDEVTVLRAFESRTGL
jgi:recombination protein RecR